MIQSQDCLQSYQHPKALRLLPYMENSSQSPKIVLTSILIKAPPNTPKHLPLKKNDSTTAKKEAEAAKSAVDDMRSFPIKELPNSNPGKYSMHDLDQSSPNGFCFGNRGVRH